MICKFRKILTELFCEGQKKNLYFRYLFLSPLRVAMENKDVNTIQGFESWSISNVVHRVL